MLAAGTAMRDQDHDRDHRPDDLDLGVVDQGRVGFGALRLTELDERVDHHAEDDRRAIDTQTQKIEHVQAVDLLALS